MGHWDGYAGNRNNWYAFRARDSGRLSLIPWGADSVLRDRQRGPVEAPRSLLANGRICSRLWELPEIRTRYREEMQRLLDDVWKEDVLLAYIDEVEKLSESRSIADPDDRLATLADIREFVAGRRQQIEAELDGPAPEWPAELNRENDPTITPPRMEIVGSFSTEVLGEQPSRQTPPEMFMGLGETRLQVRVDDEVVSPFTQFGAISFVSSRGIRIGYPTVNLVAKSDSDDENWWISLVIDPYQVASGERELPVDEYAVWARVGKMGADGTRGQRRIFGVKGSLRLTEFDTKLGETISGEFKLITDAFN